MPFLFAVTLLVSATLLFLVEPMIAKMILPKFGGTPAVWNGCMIFFQAVLLAGYSYAHYLSSRFDLRRQRMVQIGVLFAGWLLAPLLLLPLTDFGKNWAPPDGAYPLPWLLGFLFVCVGMPFFVLTTMAPLLQKWFAALGHPSAKDPYFLYAASNVGSLTALLIYPAVVEPFLHLQYQVWLWVGGYALLALLALICVGAMKKAASVSQKPTDSGPWASERETQAGDPLPDGRGSDPLPDGRGSWGPHADEPAPTWFQRLLWVFLAFVPSSMMLGVTTYLSTDVAPIPLIWVVPLGLYLLSFILVFSRLPPFVYALIGMAFPMLTGVLLYWILFGAWPDLWVEILTHWLLFFLAAMICHGKLARSRPSSQHLTEFYLWMSVGGVLGGLFNGLLAPLVFKSLTEYPVTIVLAFLILLFPVADGRSGRGPRWLDFVVPILVGAIGLAAIFAVPFLKMNHVQWMVRYVPESQKSKITKGLSRLVEEPIVLRERSFYGVLRVAWDKDDGFHKLYHGTTLHGQQPVDGNGVPVPNSKPLTYYYPNGPIGQVFQVFRGPTAKPNVALIGLGTGSLGAYGEAGQHFTFFEIDPAIVRIAKNPAYFSYLKDCQAEVNIVIGDARLSLQKRERAPDGHYGLIVVDAFSSDAIPVHLLTREALQLYFSKLTENGILALHVSNRYLNLKPVAANLAEDAGLLAFAQKDWATDEEEADGKSGSDWVLVVRRPEDLGPLLGDPRWQPLAGDPQAGVWTDDFSNVLRVMEFQWGD